VGDRHQQFGVAGGDLYVLEDGGAGCRADFQLFCHRADLHTPVEETVRAMNHVIGQGKALYWGTSEWPAERILEAHHVARRERLIPPLMEQPQYNLFHRDRFEREYAPLYERIGLGTTIWSPLASGLLTGKLRPETTFSARDHRNYNRRGEAFDVGETFSGVDYEEGLRAVEELHAVVPSGASMAQVALRWTLMFPEVTTAIPGAKTVQQAEDNARAADLDPLSDEAMALVRAVYDRRFRAAIHDRW